MTSRSVRSTAVTLALLSGCPGPNDDPSDAGVDPSSDAAIDGGPDAAGDPCDAVVTPRSCRPSFEGLSASVEIVRDADGVPHLYGANASDTFFASGYMQAHDRMLQMELMRRRALGRRAELLGEGAVDDDTLMRTLDLAHWGAVNASTLAREDPEQYALLEAWAAGVNRRLAEIRDGSVTGNGTLKGGKGRFDLKVANLDLNAFVAELRPMRLGGPLGVTLAGDVTTVDFNLSDPKLALGARAKVALTPQQTVLTDARVSAGKGRIDLTGVFRHDAHSSYDAKATLTTFDPLLLAAMSAPKAGGGKAPAKAAKAPATRGETRVSGTLTASAPSRRSKTWAPRGGSKLKRRTNWQNTSHAKARSRSTVCR